MLAFNFAAIVNVRCPCGQVKGGRCIPLFLRQHVAGQFSFQLDDRQKTDLRRVFLKIVFTV